MITNQVTRHLIWGRDTEEDFDEWRSLAIKLAPGPTYRGYVTVQEMDLQPGTPSKLCKSVQEVYREVAIKEIERTDSLEILSAVQHDPSLLDIDTTFPSWAPRWKKCIDSSALGRVDSSHIASANKKHVITPILDLDILKV
ncbi:hypothetical protein G7Y89_g4352 [Cudoniella acicularis]|uniref:Uncharacterized protein n=1 Tax=Cudoniella acicularis TaxID=354080 RepID=A0A8H4W4S6_9HELO|nr:hypothetical protein G7Y89_g4352 [Cudoniella acicularis]